MIKYFLLLFPFLLLSACYEDVEGCLDVNAANYDLDADVSCPDDCCQYPELSVSFQHLYGTDAIKQDSFYQDGAGHPYRISRLRYYWSDLQFQTVTGEFVEPTSSLEIGLVPTLGDTILTTVNDNLLLAQLGSNSATNLGTFRTEEEVSGLIGILGVEDSLQIAAPATAPTNHPLGFQEGRLHFGLDTGYVQCKLEYDLVVGTDTLARTVTAFGNQAFFLDFGAPTALPRGFNVSLSVGTDLELLLDGLDLNENEEELASIIAQRLPFVFRLVE